MGIQSLKSSLISTGVAKRWGLAPSLHRVALVPDKLTILTSISLFGLFVAILAAVQFATPNLVGNDGYYHIKLAQIMRTQGLHPPFEWLPLTILNRDTYVDHHFLYHILLIPFTYGDLRVGAKWASVVLPALAFVAGWIFLRGQQVPYAGLWSLGFLAVSEAFLYRMSMPRAQSVSLLVLILSLHFMLTRQERWLLPLAFLYVWLYDAFPLILVLAGGYVGLRWLLEQELNIRPVFYATLGIGAGLLINPYFPDNLIFIYHHLFPKLAETTAISVGNEWQPYKTWTLVDNSGPALAVFIAGMFALGWHDRKINTPTATLFFSAVLFGAMLFKSRRFVEYFPAFALLFCALAWAPLFKRWAGQSHWFGRELPVALTILLIPAILFNVQASQESLQDSKPYRRFAAASGWLEANTPPGSRVFQTDWDDFTRLFFYNTHNTYTLGLDPTYMQRHDSELYDLWVDITRGRVKTPARSIAKTFGASYVITDLDHTGFLRQAETDPNLIERYRDDEAVVFQVLYPTQEVKHAE